VAIGRAAAAGRGPLAGIGVDTWGVDYGLLGEGGGLAGLPVHYRDARTNGAPERVFGRVSRERVFERTGIQVMAINTLFQLAAAVERTPRLLEAADTLLFMPDLFHYLLTGRAAVEFTIATTSQMLDPRTGDWAVDMLRELGLPAHLLGPVVPPGTEYGSLLPAVADATGAGPVP
jgi:rhamnulokinase